MKDKIYHIGGGLVVAFVCSLPAVVHDYAIFSAIWSAVTSGLFAAGIKEWCDMRTPGNKWDWKDFGFTCIGVLIAVLILLGMHYGLG